MSDHNRPTLRPTLGAWAGLLLVAEIACEALGTKLSWKTKSATGEPDDEYLSLMTSAPPTGEGQALMDLLDQLESLSVRIDPKTGRMRSNRPNAAAQKSVKPRLEGGHDWEELVAAATRTFGNRDQATAWALGPNRALNGRSPQQALDEGDAAEIYRVLGRIDHGIFE
ncbi:MAG: antitoxin Xre/MbcA/ParS toxin-binding domain-containing protein [Gemmatimonadaceae bacterium]